MPAVRVDGYRDVGAGPVTVFVVPGLGPAGAEWWPIQDARLRRELPPRVFRRSGSDVGARMRMAPRCAGALRGESHRTETVVGSGRQSARESLSRTPRVGHSDTASPPVRHPDQTAITGSPVPL